MNWLDTTRTGLQAVRAHRLRSGLTVLGILIGIATVVLSVGLGEGTKSSVSAQISALGSNLLIVSPGSSTSSSGIRGGLGSASTLTVQDATALASSDAAPDIQAVAAVSTTNGQLNYGSTNWTTTLTATTASYETVRSRSVSLPNSVRRSSRAASVATSNRRASTLLDALAFFFEAGLALTGAPSGAAS